MMDKIKKDGGNESEKEGKRGPKGKYAEWIESDGLLKISAWARDGLTDVEIANKMCISESTLNEWKKKYPEISESLKNGKEVVDIGVENSLLKKAHGYNAKVLKTFKLKKVWYDDKNNRCEQEYLEQVEDEIHVPADTTAQIFWLKNRKTKEWRDKQEVEHSGEIKMPTITIGK
jgi:hypothetical protein